jgi:hypothetical protein
MNGQMLLLGALAGVLTTATADLGALLGARLRVGGVGPRRSGPDIIGRWFRYMLRGKFRHDDILQTPRLPGELPLGLVIHYLIGIVFTLAFGAIVLALHMTATILPALVFGLATVVFPWFLMLPSQGMGWMGRDAGPNTHLGRMSLYTHFIFGVALALWTTLLRPF